MTEQQQEIIEYAAQGVPSYRLDQFRKYIKDALRGRREILDDDVRHTVSSALIRYGKRRA